MPLSSLQHRVLTLLAAHRSPDSYVAGGVALNVRGPRISKDIDIFNDSAERMAAAASADAGILIAHGFDVKWKRQRASIHSAWIAAGGETMELDWVTGSDYRFFPTLRDELFGYRLHPVDLAANKVSAAIDRREPRDAVDLVTIHERLLPLGAVVWAACDRFQGWTPEGMLNEMRRNAKFSPVDFEQLNMPDPAARRDLVQRLRAALDDAETFVAAMPSRLVGNIFIAGGRAVQPGTDRLDSYQLHKGARRGHWPSSGAIEASMMEGISGSSRSGGA